MRKMPRRLGPTFMACSTYQSFLSFSFEGPSLAAPSLVKTCRPRLYIRLSATSFDFGHVIWCHFLVFAWRISNNARGLQYSSCLL